MESPMRNLILSGVAAIALSALPALAQDAGADVNDAAAAPAPAATLTDEQQAMVDAWPADKQTMYAAWSPDYQAYFWTLSPEQQAGYWVLTPTQRSQIAAMTPEQRTVAWQSIGRQLAAGADNSDTSIAARTGDDVPAPAQTADQANADAAPPAPTTTVVAAADPQSAASGASAVVTSIPGNLTPPPASALNKDYPVCTSKLQDSCQNPGEGGAPGRSRALKYWPGKPASEGK